MTYLEVAEELKAQNPDVELSQMFGMPVLKFNRKAFAGDWHEAMVFKLTGQSHARALKIKGAELFDPGMGRPMKEWVVVPAAASADWPGLALAALDYIETLTKP